MTSRSKILGNSKLPLPLELVHLQVAALEATANPILISTQQGTIVWVNAAFENLSGYSRSEAIGQNTRLLSSRRQPPEFYKQMWNTILSGKIWQGELCNKRKDGSLYQEEMTITPVKNSGGGITHFIAMKLDITERKRAEDSLQESRERLRLFIEHAPVALAMFDRKMNYLHASRRWRTDYALGDRDLQGVSHYEVFPAIPDRWKEAHQRGLLGEIVRNEDDRFVQPNGSVQWIRWEIQPWYGNQGEIGGILIFTEDISTRKRAEQELANGRAKLDAALASMTDAVFISDTNGQFVEFNEAFATFHKFKSKLECSHSLSAYTDILDVYLPNGDLAKLDQWAVPRALRGETVTNAEYRLHRRDTGETWSGSYNFSPLRDQTGTVVGCVVVARDITLRKQEEVFRNALLDIAQAADQTQTLEELYKKVHEIIKSIVPADSFYIALQDEKTGEVLFPYYIDDVDPPLSRRRSGKGRTEYVLQTGLALRLDEAGDQEMRRQGKIVAYGKPTAQWVGVPLRVDDKTFGVMVVQHYTDPRAFSDSHVQILKNISSHVAKVIARKRAEEDRRVAEEHFDKAFHASPVGIGISTIEGIFLDVNDALSLETEYTSEELIGSPISALYVNQEDRDRLTDLIHSGAPVRDFKFRLRTKTGKIRNVVIAAERLEVQGVDCVLTLVTDTTEHELLEQQLRHAQRMEAIGNLAGGVAHDFNNMLGVIMGNMELMGERVPPDEIFQKYLEKVRMAVRSATNVTRQLLAFSRKQILQPVILDVNASVKQLHKMTQRLIGENIRVTLFLEPEIGSVRADPGQIEQVLMNLVVNARDAMPDGGGLSIATSNVTLDSDFEKTHMGSKAGAYIKLAVSDTGIGMKKEVLEHIFEPFFTTKEVGKGTGLGLATVYGSVKQSGGYIWVESEPGNGTTFDIYLPRVDSEPATERPQKDSFFSRGSETILLVEDEQSLREVTRAQLEKMGYQVYDAEDAERAMILFDQHAEEIGLLLTDIIMPGVNGRVLADQLRMKKPDLRLLFMSGYTDDEIIRHGVSEATHGLVIKPFSFATLATRIREILDAKLVPH
ncbi:MAG: PAS domain S-box protein [Candidatus Acidiferrum sp.]